MMHRQNRPCRLASKCTQHMAWYLDSPPAPTGSCGAAGQPANSLMTFSISSPPSTSKSPGCTRQSGFFIASCIDDPVDCECHFEGHCELL